MLVCDNSLYVMVRSDVRGLLDVSNSITHLDRHLYLSGTWLSVAPRMDTKNTCVEKRLEYMLKI